VFTKKAFLLCLLLGLAATVAASDQPKENKAVERVQSSADVLNEIQAAPDKGIPEDVLASAECVAVVPSMLKAGFVFGGRYGRGVASCRTPQGWSAPTFFRIEGGSFGLQIGGEAVDLVMLVMNKDGMKKMMSSKFKLGADASVAAGPVGRHAAADTDWKLRAQVLSYSRTRGVFGGLELNGAVVTQDKSATRDFYGHLVLSKTSLQGQLEAPREAYPFLETLAKWAKAAASK